MIKWIVTYLSNTKKKSNTEIIIDWFEFDIQKKIEDFEDIQDLKKVIKLHLHTSHWITDIKFENILIINLLYFTNKNF